MPERLDTETSALPPTSPVPAALMRDSGGAGDDGDPFPYLLRIGGLYDGPLDVLLALIKKRNLDIYDLPMGKITAQFQAYAGTIPPEEVETAAEFVFMASQLILIKSRMLLPSERTVDSSTIEDPRRSLVERLLEYELVKQAAQMLRERQWAETSRWTNSGGREVRDRVEPPGPDPDESSSDLASAFQKIIDRVSNRPALTVANEAATVAGMFDYMCQRLEIEDAPISFEEALGGSTSPRIIAAAFLAVLEMVRVGAVLLKQDKQGGTILVKKTRDFEHAINSAGSLDQWM